MKIQHQNIVQKIVLFLCLTLLPISLTYSQDDLMDMLEDDDEDEVIYTSATFKTTRIIGSHTTDIQAPKELQFLISHRFGTLNSGPRNLWGLDESQIRFGFEIGINKNWAIGFGRSSEGKMFDFYSKIKLLRQSSGAKNMPISLVLLTSMNARTTERSESQKAILDTKHDISYVHQLLIARKMSSNVSFQLMPTFVHRNLVSTALDNNDIFALGAGARFKFTPRFGIVLEYSAVFDDRLKEQDLFDPLGIGLELETGGHVFHITFSNSTGMNDYLMLTQTTGDWGNGDVHIGFNISRVFSFGGEKKKLQE